MMWKQAKQKPWPGWCKGSGKNAPPHGVCPQCGAVVLGYSYGAIPYHDTPEVMNMMREPLGLPLSHGTEKQQNEHQRL